MATSRDTIGGASLRDVGRPEVRRKDSSASCIRRPPRAENSSDLVGPAQ